MKLLAKAALFPGQVEARKVLAADGIEPLLLARDFFDDTTWNDQKAAATEAKLLSYVQDQDFKHFGFEFADSVGKYGINPCSNDPQTRAFSQDTLNRLTELVNRLHAASGKVGYFQYQLIFDAFNDEGHSPAVNRKELLHQLGEYHASLQRKSDVQLQMENGIRVNPAFSTGTPTDSAVLLSASDYKTAAIPLALDTSHYAQVLDLYADARHESGNLYSIVGKSKRKPDGERFYIVLSDEEAAIANTIRANPSRRDAITSELERVIAQPIIGSVQFAGAEDNKGYGINDLGAGYNGENDLVDVPRVVKAAIKANVPYLIPEFKETDYIGIPNQKRAVELVRKLQSE